MCHAAVLPTPRRLRTINAQQGNRKHLWASYSTTHACIRHLAAQVALGSREEAGLMRRPSVCSGLNNSLVILDGLKVRFRAERSHDRVRGKSCSASLPLQRALGSKEDAQLRKWKDFQHSGISTSTWLQKNKIGCSDSRTNGYSGIKYLWHTLSWSKVKTLVY